MVVIVVTTNLQILTLLSFFLILMSLFSFLLTHGLAKTAGVILILSGNKEHLYLFSKLNETLLKFHYDIYYLLKDIAILCEVKEFLFHF